MLPSDVALARELLGELLDAEQQIAEQCYEDDFPLPPRAAMAQRTAKVRLMLAGKADLSWLLPSSRIGLRLPQGSSTLVPISAKAQELEI